MMQLMVDNILIFHSLFFSDDFKGYSEICFKNFGDRVKNWMTFNEPSSMAGRGNEFGIAPPFGSSGVPIQLNNVWVETHPQNLT